MLDEELRNDFIKIVAEFVVATADEGDVNTLDGLTGSSRHDADVLRQTFASRGHDAAAKIMETMRDHNGSCPSEWRAS